MALNNNTTEILVQCSACSDIYNEPYRLSCGHTACLACILKIEKQNKVRCPDCYVHCKFNDIQPDRRTQSTLDDYYGKSCSNTLGKSETDSMSSVGVLNSPFKWCDLCHNKPNTCKCVKCDIYICTECKSSHINSFGNLDHNIISMEKNVQELRMTLKNVINSIAKEKQQLISNAKLAQQSLESFYFAEAKELINLRRLQLLRTKELQDYHNKLESQMRGHNKRTTDTLRTYEDSLTNAIEKLTSKMELLVQVLKMNDTCVLEDTIGTVKRETIPEMKKIKSKMGERPTNISPAKVVKCKSWNPASSTVVSGRLNVSEPKLSAATNLTQGQGKLPSSSVRYQPGNPSRPNSKLYKSASPARPTRQPTPRGPTNFSGLRGMFGSVQEALLPYTPQSVTLIDNRIFCTGHSPDGLYVYNKNLTLENTIQSPKIQRPKAVAKVGTGFLIVACDDDFGLHQYSELGIDKVASGSFSDVCWHTQEECAKMYALEYKLYRILIFKCKSHALIPIKKISLHYENFSQWDTLKVYNDGMYVSSFQNNHIYQYTDEGDLVKIGRGGSRMAGLFLMPRLSEVDCIGSVVALDSVNKRIQVYNRGHDWTVLPLRGNLRKPMSMAVDRTLEYVWLVDIGLRKLVALVPVRDC